MQYETQLDRARILFISRRNLAPPEGLMRLLAGRGTTVDAIHIDLPKGRIRRYLPPYPAISALRSSIECFDPDIIVFNDENSRAGLLAIMRANSLSRPIIWFRGAIGGYNAFSPIDRFLLRHKDLARLIVRSYAMINNWAGSLLLTHLLNFSRIDCCPHHIEANPASTSEIQALRSKWGIAEGDLVIGSIANARPIKNIEFAARAASAVKHHQRVHFLYIGAHDEAFRKRIEAINPEYSILTGPVPNAGRYAGVFDVFVSPTKRPGEGFGLGLAEAMASGVPVVATQFGGATYLVDHGVTGLLLPETLTSWIQALQKLVDDETLRKRMGAAAKRRITERFSLEATSSDLMRILQEVLIERTAR